MDDKKLENIEVALAHQDQQIQELGTVITDQWKQIELLNRRLDKALSKIDQIEGDGQGDGGDTLADQRPPHY